MGKPQSVPENHSETQIAIINQLKQNGDQQEKYQWLLYAVIIMLAIIIFVAMAKKFLKWQRAEAIRAARNLAAVNV